MSQEDYDNIKGWRDRDKCYVKYYPHNRDKLDNCIQQVFEKYNKK